jgi:alpha-galactosidase
MRRAKHCSTKSLSPSIRTPEGRQPWIVKNENGKLVCARPLADGDYAIGFFNLSDEKQRIFLDFWDIGLPTASGYSLRFRDLYAHEDLGDFAEYFETTFEPHAGRVYRAKLVKAR